MFSNASIIKELKTQVDSLRNELTETKELLSALNNFTMENSKKIMEITSGDFEQLIEENIDYTTFVENANFSEIQDLQEDIVDDEFVGANLKKIIENQINANM